jgi:DNA-binding Xre family transcriptional regulator
VSITKLCYAEENIMGVMDTSRMIRLRVKEVAERHGYKMAQLARRADIDLRTLRRIYRDPTAEVSTYTLNKLAKALGVSPLDLIENVPE